MEIAVLIAIFLFLLIDFVDRKGWLKRGEPSGEEEIVLRKKKAKVESKLYKTTKEVRKAGDR